MPLVQGVLDDTALQLLANELWDLLDVSSTSVSEAGLLAAVAHTPLLHTLDVTGCVKLLHMPVIHAGSMSLTEY